MYEPSFWRALSFSDIWWTPTHILGLASHSRTLWSFHASSPYPRPAKRQILSSVVPLQPARDSLYVTLLLHFSTSKCTKGSTHPTPPKVLLPLTYLGKSGAQVAPTFHKPVCFQLPLRYYVTVPKSCHFIMQSKKLSLNFILSFQTTAPPMEGRRTTIHKGGVQVQFLRKEPSHGGKLYQCPSVRKWWQPSSSLIATFSFLLPLFVQSPGWTMHHRFLTQTKPGVPGRQGLCYIQLYIFRD